MAKNIILNGAMEHWQKKWTISTTGQHLKNIQTRVSLGNSSKCLKSRKSQISLHQIKLGRSDLNGQDPINKKQLNEKLCIFCNCVEDTEHYILFCHRYSCQRCNMFLQIESRSAENNISSRDVRNNRKVSIAPSISCLTFEGRSLFSARKSRLSLLDILFSANVDSISRNILRLCQEYLWQNRI